MTIPTHMIIAAADQLRTELYYDGISITHDNSKRIAELVLRRALQAAEPNSPCA